MEDYSIFYKEIEKLRKKDPYSSTGQESDRSLSARLGVSHRLIKLWREGNNPDLSTINQIVTRLNLSEDQFLTLVYAASGKAMAEDDIPVYAQETTKYEHCNLEGPICGRVSRFNIKLGITAVRKSYRAFRLSPEDKFVDPDVPKESTLVFSLARNEPTPNGIFLFADKDGNIFVRRVITRGRQIWLQGGLEDAYKVDLSEFQDTVVGQVILVIKRVE